MNQRTLRLVLNLPCMSLIFIERKVSKKIPFSNTIKYAVPPEGMAGEHHEPEDATGLIRKMYGSLSRCFATMIPAKPSLGRMALPDVTQNTVHDSSL
jgi:hypothetical protein